MLTGESKIIETFSGLGRLHLADRAATVSCVLRVYQDYAGDTPTLRHADGEFADLPSREAVSAIMSGAALDLELHDGRKAKIFLTDSAGRFTVTGPLA